MYRVIIGRWSEKAWSVVEYIAKRDTNILAAGSEGTDWMPKKRNRNYKACLDAYSRIIATEGTQHAGGVYYAGG